MQNFTFSNNSSAGVAAGGTAGYVAEHCLASCGFCEDDVMTKKGYAEKK